MTTHAFQDAAHVIPMRNELTADHCQSFRAQVGACLEGDRRDVVLDLSNLEVLDSQGLETLLWLQETCVEKLGQLRLACCQEHILKVLDITRLKHEFQIHETVESALESLR